MKDYMLFRTFHIYRSGMLLPEKTLTSGSLRGYKDLAFWRRRLVVFSTSSRPHGLRCPVFISTRGENKNTLQNSESLLKESTIWTQFVRFFTKIPDPASRSRFFSCSTSIRRLSGSLRSVNANASFHVFRGIHILPVAWWG
jgi:hypothetical protein